ncbi:MAG: acyl-CoA dehydratase activase-related protein [Chloroflexota bacterium]
MRVGLPRALLYYEFAPLWEAFFKALGADVVVSPPSNRAILEQGVRATVDEACLPVKVALGHIGWLASRCDSVFVPRVVSWQRQAYTCPKLMGLPDVAAAGLPGQPMLLAPTVDFKKRRHALTEAALAAASPITRDRRRVLAALQLALAAQERAAADQGAGRLPAGFDPGGERADADVTLALIGHPYSVYDRLISLDLIRRLREQGARVVTAEMLPREESESTWEGEAKPLYWTFSRRAAGCALNLIHDQRVDGLVYLVTFGCGPDSLTGELLVRRVQHEYRMPLLLLTVDEHTGEAGVVTRIEAFLDLIRWRRAQ